MSQQLSITLTHDAEALSALRPEWDGLLRFSPTDSIFLTWEWLATWWEVYQPGRQLWLLLARDSGERLVGAAPLMLCQRSAGPLRWRELLFLSAEEGLGDPDHIDFPIASGWAEPAIRGFWHELASKRGQWDVLNLTGLHPDSPLPAYAPELGVEVIQEAGEACPYILLPDCWETYLHETLSQDHRRGIRRYGRRLEQEIGDQSAYHEVTSKAELDRMLDTLITFRRQYARLNHLPDFFGTPEAIAFHKKLAERLFERGWLHAHYLTIKGQMAAWVYDFKYKGVAYGYQTGYDPQWAYYSPGRLIIAYSIRAAIEQGLYKYDMLRGDETYKTGWAKQLQTDINLRVIASPQAQTKMMRLEALRRLWKTIKVAVPAAWRARIRRASTKTQALRTEAPPEQPE
jgi:CelD/BcsL family acetyltransferase involved in cellulose biosynthesis